MQKHDIRVWIDDEGDVVSCGKTREGEAYLRTLYPKYRNGDILELTIHPDDIPEHITLGLQRGPDRGSITMRRGGMFLP